MSFFLYVDEVVGTSPPTSIDASWILCRTLDDCVAVWEAHKPTHVLFKECSLSQKFAKWLTERNEIDALFDYSICYNNTLEVRTVNFVLTSYITYIKSIDNQSKL